MDEWLNRTEMLLGREAIKKLKMAKVAVFGVGGVGGHCVEALGRSGIGKIELIDKDVVDISNLNRQIIALRSTVGKPKVEVAKERLLDINPDIEVNAVQCFYLPETSARFDFSSYDYVVDAVDTVSAKISIITKAVGAGVPVISSMGAGNKLDPSRFRVADIYETSTDPLAKVMRRELKKRNIERLKVVFSDEQPGTFQKMDTDESAGQEPGRKKVVPGSCAFVPAAAGLIIAGEVIKDIAGVR